MSRGVNIALNLVVWAALVLYLVVSARHCSRREAGLTCTGTRIVVRDSLRTGLITSGAIRALIARNDLDPTGDPIRSIDARQIERLIARQPAVEEVRVYHTLDGIVHIEVGQCTPILRVQSENGYRFYLTADSRVIPVGRPAGIDVPIVTGNPTFPFGTEFAGKIEDPAEDEKISDKNVIFCRNLINFVEFLRRDSFWCDQIVQIDVARDNEVILIPRVGAGIIRLGNLEGYEEKLDKLLRFYRRGLAYEGWNKYRIIDIRFRDQVVGIP